MNINTPTEHERHIIRDKIRNIGGFDFRVRDDYSPILIITDPKVEPRLRSLIIRHICLTSPSIETTSFESAIINYIKATL